MALTPGTRLNPYEIVSPLGAGGMGEVYRARDTKLGRQVAIKVLPEAVATDPERVARFEREAKVLASLNHPHIAALFGMEEADPSAASEPAFRFLVMELVEGETLAERIARGPLSVEEALKIALQIAEALEAAHETGIIHRDLKPANVKITPDDKVKVLDFGLAKAMDARSSVDAAGAPSDRPFRALSASPTLSAMATSAGVILGTAAYMSPEQAKGLSTDARSDVFSFGIVLYEMLTGRQPFDGETAPEVLASVLIRDADLSALPPNLNARLNELLKRCLDKNPKKRWQAVGDLRAEIETIARSPRTAPTVTTQAFQRALPLWRRAIPHALTASVTAALAAFVVWATRPPPAPTPIVARSVFTLPEGTNFTNLGRQVLAISPDGARIVYVANRQLYLRSMSELEARPMTGTEAPQSDFVSSPVFSPDGESIAFWTGPSGVTEPPGTLKRIAVTGGAPVTICQVITPYGIQWVGNELIVGQGPGGIVRVSADGGKPEPLVTVENGERAHGPQLLPGGEEVLFTIALDNQDPWDNARIVVQHIGSPERKPIIDGGSDARYVATGHVVYALGGVVFAVPFDLRRLEVTGGPVPVLEGVRRMGDVSFSGAAHFSVSSTGSLIYIPGPLTPTGLAPQRQLALVDRKGGIAPLKIAPGEYESPRVSPDGKRVVYGVSGREAVVQIYELSGMSMSRRLTFGGNNRLPVWSSDGEHVAFQSDREGDLGIFWQRADGTDVAERLTRADTGTTHAPESWLPGGDVFLFRVTKDRTVTLWTFSLKNKKAEPFGDVQSMTPTHAMFSPDGHWVAYSSDEGRSQATRGMWVQPFPATGAKHQLATGGSHVVWLPGGKEIIYTTGPNTFVSQSITSKPGFTFGNQVPVVTGPLITLPPFQPKPFDVMPDGRLLGLIPPAEAGELGAAGNRPQIHVVINWTEELKAKAPNRR